MAPFLRNILPARFLGFLDYHLRPALRQGFLGPFNGQCGRQQLFLDIVRSLPLTHIIETGTYRGTTTEFMSRESALPIFSTEIALRYYTYSKYRFSDKPSVRLHHGDSRSGLLIAHKEWANGDALPFCYLDAHWNADLPLRDEISFILSTYNRSIIMIDDYCVSDDIGYRYDTYVDGTVLNLSLIADLLATFGASAFFPALPSGRESGMKSGCLVIVSHALLSEARALTGLRPAGTASIAAP